MVTWQLLTTLIIRKLKVKFSNALLYCYKRYLNNGSNNKENITLLVSLIPIYLTFIIQYVKSLSQSVIYFSLTKLFPKDWSVADSNYPFIFPTKVAKVNWWGILGKLLRQVWQGTTWDHSLGNLMKVSPAPLSVHFNSTLQIFPPRTILKHEMHLVNWTIALSYSKPFVCPQKNGQNQPHCDAESLIGHLRGENAECRTVVSCQHSFLTILISLKNQKAKKPSMSATFWQKSI